MNFTHFIVGALVGLLCLLTEGGAIRCSMCDTEKDGFKCLIAPPKAADCEPFFSHCISVAKYSLDDKLIDLTRSCSPTDFKASCTPGVDKENGGAAVIVCTQTCDWDGCNGGRSTPSLHSFYRRK